MFNAGKKLSEELKDKILKESFESGCVVSQLARSYQISVKTLHGWRKKFRKEQSEAGRGFVELKVEEQRAGILKKAELVFDDYSIILEGRISTNKLLEIIRMSEG